MILRMWWSILSLIECVIYTDGSSGSSGDGGWAAIVATPYFGIEICGGRNRDYKQSNGNGCSFRRDEDTHSSS
jgi:hypothetical protein